ncbi:Zn(2)-Cys(6) zinc finger domain protein [Metarhizium robertsii]|uniref:Zn(2)-C6 fungal-type DNA-binding domain protein n=2 Tax=Metarhizium robertsii TaxID=568076 RepID=E9EXS0_METRA|nr:Zn(2)-C6 fungal-type DNA-binding domain protein [Metarhizium robertsii ARSEF 23]EFY99890.1 Zn(2)-C6 fungal-type DNA-binding domain protein [Metarhizium robertsii ARSEF 23]EXV06584.1 Zn(2)-Cys(6) zinc finger domain protein [Metarhizium robertsii]
MLSAWRYDSDTKEVVVPRSYDPANGRSSKIQACKICREKKTRCDGDGYKACNRCRCKGLTCEYTSCGRSKRAPRLSKSSSSSPGSSSSSICKPRPQPGRKHSLVRASAASSSGSSSSADDDSSDTLSDKTVSPVPWQTGPQDVFDAAAASAAANFAIDPLLLQHVHESAQHYAGLEHYAGDEFLFGVDVDMQCPVTGTDMYHDMHGDAFHVPLGNGDDESLWQCGLRWLPNGPA